MNKFERRIQIAYDKKNDKKIYADDIFNKKNNPFKFRTKYYEEELQLTCLECGQELIISKSKFNIFYFKHKPRHDYCILSDIKISTEEIKNINKTIIRKESPRHKELKNKIGKLLEKIEGVDKKSINIDNRFIFLNNKKRKPDVYFRYKNKEIVFEIQLSKLSPKYIQDRYNFYKKHNIFLVWILDNIIIRNQRVFEKDIKYLSKKYQNIFKLDETSHFFKLECYFKYSFLTNDNKLLSKWKKKSVSLNELKFDEDEYQIYYYNFEDSYHKLKLEQKSKAIEIRKKENEEIQEQKKENAEIKSHEIIEKIKKLKKNKILNYNDVLKELASFDNFETEIFNSILNLNSKKASLIKWIDKSDKHDEAFLNFILTTPKIKFNINEKDEKGRTAFQAIFENNKINRRHDLIKLIFKRNYILTNEDKEFFLKLKTAENKNLILYNLCSNLSNRDLVDDVFKFDSLLFVIESSKFSTVVGYNRAPSDIIWLANNAINHHNKYWSYIERAFKYYKFWNKIEELDTKKSFEKKLKKLHNNMPKQQSDFNRLFIDLYPEIHYNT